MATLALTAASPLSESEHQVQLRRAVIASTIGTAIEWYDFFLYSTSTGLVFAKLFFPATRIRSSAPSRLSASTPWASLPGRWVLRSSATMATASAASPR